ncbi:hypothetical protein [Actinoplanes flavus]|uniref:hypothetical protein n=1 Tax=Actinoplanes flavus TaxID=2820290 RepID=UPI001EE62AEA|nr:hypothetical protein [Actinoplanes flavus]
MAIFSRSSRLPVRQPGASRPELTDPYVPSRPDWNCKAPGCGQPWPCETEKAELLWTFREARLVLRMYLAAHMQDAIDDAVRHPFDVDIDFWPRFLGWVPSVAPHPAGPEAGSGPAGATGFPC